MIIPLYVDKIKDKELIDWLKTKTNRSATIREILYSYIKNIDNFYYLQTNKNVTNEKENIKKIDENFINSLKEF